MKKFHTRALILCVSAASQSWAQAGVIRKSHDFKKQIKELKIQVVKLKKRMNTLEKRLRSIEPGSIAIPKAFQRSWNVLQCFMALPFLPFCPYSSANLDDTWNESGVDHYFQDKGNKPFIFQNSFVRISSAISINACLPVPADTRGTKFRKSNTQIVVAIITPQLTELSHTFSRPVCSSVKGPWAIKTWNGKKK